ncbi:alpha/beta fold hydrolase [Candidatus Rariloculus sp.]|uniref:alpha/beta fold hydrolase n=1 Tax=Candidatus Rariloculus sp. TaxID=3101265 RepID=UPI003D0B6280
MDRRELLRNAAALAAASALKTAAAQSNEADSILFPGFDTERVTTSGAEINCVIGGEGPPLLLLHGAPQSHASWFACAPELARNYTVVAADLRGYGDSSKPEDGENHYNHSKRAMALDQVEVMQHFGFERFRAVGHDRGGRVMRRMALDHPERVEKLAVLDIVPAHYLYNEGLTKEFVNAYFHWFLYVRPAPFPENIIAEQMASRQRSRPHPVVAAEYARTFSNPATIHAMCEDYRASASIDLEFDEADMHRKIECPVLALWSAQGTMGRRYDVLATWRMRATNVTGKAMPGGHSFHETHSEETLAEIMPFLAA